MASIVGTIRSGGAGLAGLTIRAFEEIQVGIELDDEVPPCRMGQPSTLLVGTATTDPDGQFRIVYTPRTRPDDACAFRATVRIAVLDGATSIWQSPKRPAAPTVRFDHDLLPAPPPPDPDADARLTGTITRCGRPAAGFRVVGYEETQVGFPMPPRPCVLASPTRRLLGTVVVDAQGQFVIRYRASDEPEDACRFLARVRVEAYEANVLVWRSAAMPAGPTVRFDRELYPGCQPGSTLVRVTNEAGARVAGAEVFVGGELRGSTDSLGQLFVAGAVPGSTIVARLRLHEQATGRGGHSDGGSQGWSYRVYATSLRLTYGASGDNPAFAPFVVADPAAIQSIVIERRNVVIGYNVLVSVEWDATVGELMYIRDRMLDFSELLFNGTDAQFLVEAVTVVDNGRSWDQADFRVLASWNQPSNADVGAIAGDGRIRMNPFDMFFPGIVLHEWGHYALWARDEYKPADCWPDGQPVGCTLGAQTDGTVFSNGRGKDACFMRGAQFESRKKLCSSHQANPHVNCTAQGAEDCWSTVASHYGGQGAWRVLTPVSRGVLVDRLPDSGVPVASGTSPGPGADRAGSYVPLLAWKPRWHVSSAERPNPCVNLVVRVTSFGGPAVDNASVTLHTSDGRTIFQGRTGAKNLPNGVVTGPGEIALRGATVGDSVSATLPVGGGSATGSATIESCASPLVVNLSQIHLFSATVRGRLADAFGNGVVLTAEAGAHQAAEMMTVQGDGEDGAFVVHAPGTGAALLSATTAYPELHVRLTAFDPSGHPVVLHGRVARRSLHAAADRVVKSLGGEIELEVPAGAVNYPGELLFEDALDVEPPSLEPGDALIIAPQRVSASGGDDLRRPARLHLEAGSTFAPLVRAVELLRYDEVRRRWHEVPSRVHPLPLVATAVIEHLGVFCLVSRARTDQGRSRT